MKPELRKVQSDHVHELAINPLKKHTPEDKLIQEPEPEVEASFKLPACPVSAKEAVFELSVSCQTKKATFELSACLLIGQGGCFFFELFAF